MLNNEALLRIGKEVGASVSRVEITMNLLTGGATVPFIARYRKEATGNLDEVKIRDIEERLAYYNALEDRRQTVLASIEKQGKLTDELKQRILGVFTKNDLEDLYLPYKPKRKTKANLALERGLGPLAEYIWEQTGTEPVEEFARQFLTRFEEAVVPAAAAPVVEMSEPVVEMSEPGVEMAAAVVETSEPGVEMAAAAVEMSEPAVEMAAPVVEMSEPAVEMSEPVVETSESGVETSEPVVESSEPVVISDAVPVPAETSGIAAPPSEIPAPPKTVDKFVRSVEDAVDGALHILAERISENSEFRKQLRDCLSTEGVVRAHVIQGKEAEKTKYEMYYKFEETAARIPSHRMLAIRRGSRENVLTYTIEVDREKFIASLLPQVIKDSTAQFAPYLERAIRDGYDRLMAPSIQNEVRANLRDRSEAEAIRVFEENLRSLLLAAPAGSIGVMGIDPGLRTGCKVAVVDQTGKFLENHTIRPTEPHQDLEGSEKTLLDIVQKHNVRGIAIGNGTGSRETETFVRSVVLKHALDVFVVVVNESGASVYSASKRAREEFPNLDVTVRGAISIARRLQDPLAEMVKIEPRSIGVGQYQHDVDQKKLRHSLAGAVESCVNHVGVDLNTASVDLLKYVSGISEKLAGGIVAFRDQNGLLSSRAQLLHVDGFGDKTFEQAAGFLRIKDAANPLDRTAVHPESYPLVERMAASLGASVAELIESPDRIRSIDFRTFEAEAGKFTVADIREELLKPGRDPRDNFVVPKFRDDVKEIADLKEGMELEGVVTNVTNFGAFVDLGVHQDGLVHISELSHKYIQDARQAARVGDIVKVKVIAVDAKVKRISLSMKAVLPKPVRPPRPPRSRKRPTETTAVAAAQTPPEAGAVRTTQAIPTPRQDRGPGRPPDRGPRRQGDGGPRRQQDGGPRPQGDHSRPPVQVRDQGRDGRDNGQPRPERPSRPSKPVMEKTAPAANQTMDEKIRALQEKFGRVE